MSSTTNDIRTKMVALKVAAGSAEADIAFINKADRDREAFGPDAFEDGATVGMYRNHDGLMYGDRPPFAIVTVRKQAGRWTATIKFLPTPRGEEELATARAFWEAGVPQDVSVGFLVLATAPVPDYLGAIVDRYIVKAKLLELSLVTLGAIPNAQLTSVKRVAPAPAATDPADIVRERSHFERLQANAAALAERHGALALQTAADATRWLSRGRVQIPPIIKFFDGEVGGPRGVWDPQSPDVIYVKRDLSADEIVFVIGHECAHLLGGKGEAAADAWGEHILRVFRSRGAEQGP